MAPPSTRARLLPLWGLGGLLGLVPVGGWLRALRLRHQAGVRLAMAGALLCWGMAQVAAMVHPLQTQHVVCPEHGEVVEVGEPEPASAATAEEHLQAPAPLEHRHDCDLGGLMLLTSEPGLCRPPESPQVELSGPVLARSQAPRGPPLDYAPKTSPPALS